jgi:hypothetical protein
MGLGMYAYVTEDPEIGNKKVDISLTDDAYRMAYWREFNHLHEFFEGLYYEKGGLQEFNCRTVRVDYDDLDDLEERLKNNLLETSWGFLWDDEVIAKEDVEDTFTFIERARKFLNQGYVILYDSWW